MNLQRAVIGFVSLFLGSYMLSSVFAADGEQTYLVAYAKFKPGKAQICPSLGGPRQQRETAAGAD